MIEVKNIIKKFNVGTETEVTILKGISFTINEGEYVILSGASGAGKSTLMYQISLLDHPTSGEIIFDGKNISDAPEKKRSIFRLDNFGFIFQSYALNKDLTAIENVSLPLLCTGISEKKAHKESAKVLKRLGLGHRLENYPEQLSGGEQQRVSIARAIVKKPKVLFADEPTASLDVANSDEVMAILDELHAEGMTIVAITHEEQYKDRGSRFIQLSDGKIIDDHSIRHRKKKKPAAKKAVKKKTTTKKTAKRKKASTTEKK